MDDLIRRGDVIDALMSYTWHDEDDAMIDDADEKRAFIEGWFPDIPAVDAVEVRHGEWMFDFALGGSNFYKCSECGRQECLLEKYNAEEYMPYCHCGARMDGRREGG